MLPFAAWRVQHVFENLFLRSGKKSYERRFEEYLAENFYLTTSGNFSDVALIVPVAWLVLSAFFSPSTTL